MPLLNTISRTLKGLLNDAAESVQDPSRDSRQIVRELDDSIGKAENSLIEIEAQVSTQQSKRDVAAEKAKKYEDGAKRALQAGDEGLAREALGAQAAAETERDALAGELSTLEPSVAHLKEQISDMRQRRNDLNSRSNILQAKQQIAQAKDVAATALGRYRRQKPGAGFFQVGRQGQPVECAFGCSAQFRRRKERQGAGRQTGRFAPRTIGGRSAGRAQKAAQRPYGIVSRWRGGAAPRSFRLVLADNFDSERGCPPRRT